MNTTRTDTKSLVTHVSRTQGTPVNKHKKKQLSVKQYKQLQGKQVKTAQH